VAAAIGAVVILAGIGCQAVQLVVSIRDRDRNRDLTGDPWNARTLEWSTASPPPAWNFAVLPQVREKDAFWAAKRRALADGVRPARKREYASIEMPTRSAVGVITAFFAAITGFALIWHIWWMAGLGLVGAFVTVLAFAFREHEEVDIPPVQLAAFDRAHLVGVAV
jgi:cytochrome o ubiquinol oxidase subunit 1